MKCKLFACGFRTRNSEESHVKTELLIKTGGSPVLGHLMNAKDELSFLDSRKARTLLGWRNVIDVEHSVKAIVDWHHTWYDGANMHDFSLARIKEYGDQLA